MPKKRSKMRDFLECIEVSNVQRLSEIYQRLSVYGENLEEIQSCLYLKEFRWLSEEMLGGLWWYWTPPVHVVMTIFIEINNKTKCSYISSFFSNIVM